MQQSFFPLEDTLIAEPFKEGVRVINQSIAALVLLHQEMLELTAHQHRDVTLIFM